MQRILDRTNLFRALQQVTRNQGAPGLDGMTVEQLPDHLKQTWRDTRNKLLNNDYRPQPIKRVFIPKGNGEQRPLGIPTVQDRLIQQAIAQVLSEQWETRFHNLSFGFRPGRSAHQAIRQVQNFVRQGKRWVIDMDLKSFFDEVNHDKLMGTLKKSGLPNDVLRLINRYLKTPVLVDGKLTATTKGVPQGGPLSPLLANIVLNELDWTLHKRQHSFVRYADDFQILVSSRRSAERIKGSLTRFIENKLKLTVNTDKSAIDVFWKRPFLGFGLAKRDARIKVSDGAIQKLKIKIRTITRRTRGRQFTQIIDELRKSLLGWKAYFDISEVLSSLKDLDKWIRRKLRCYLWKQWGRSGYRRLRKLGVERVLAWNTAKSARGPWRLSKSPALYRALPNRYFRNLGLPELADRKWKRVEPPWYVTRMPGGVGGGAS